MFRIIAFLLLFYFLFRFLGKLLMPFMRKANGNSAQGNRRGAETDNRDEGEVRIEFTKSEEAKRKDSHREGEYVEFEELD